MIYVLFKVINENGTQHTVFENHRKSRIQHCERSELRLHFEWTEVNKNAKKLSIWRLKTVLPDRSL